MAQQAFCARFPLLHVLIQEVFRVPFALEDHELVPTLQRRLVNCQPGLIPWRSEGRLAGGAALPVLRSQKGGCPFNMQKPDAQTAGQLPVDGDDLLLNERDELGLVLPLFERPTLEGDEWPHGSVDTLFFDNCEICASSIA